VIWEESCDNCDGYVIDVLCWCDMCDADSGCGGGDCDDRGGGCGGCGGGGRGDHGGNVYDCNQKVVVNIWV
jgi:hypothetical protein